MRLSIAYLFVQGAQIMAIRKVKRMARSTDNQIAALVRDSNPNITPAIKRVTDVSPEFMSVDQAEILSDISRWTWRQYAYRGKIESRKVGARLLIPISEIRRILSENIRPRIDGLPAGAPSVKTCQRDRSVTGAARGARVHA